MDYQFKSLEKRWQQFWAQNQTFKADNTSSKPKYYVLDMFPYPSGAGLHVGHPLGYIASDIFSRYKRLKGFNVLHPMGYDSFGLPAEQYAIQTGQHPAITTEANINRYREQLDNMGFSYDWSREVRTSDPAYYKWTQWIFIQLFNSWYNTEADRAENISTLIEKFETDGNRSVQAVCDEDVPEFTVEDWQQITEEGKQQILLKFRLTYLRESTVNWCPALGTVLANDEVKDGFSERGGYPVEQKKMMQWSMRITAYADRLLKGLDTIEWPEPLKEMQRNWIGKSAGALVEFTVDGIMYTREGEDDYAGLQPAVIKVFTTRVDTIFGVSFLVIAPEHELVQVFTTPPQKEEIDNYIAQTKKKSELDRMADAKVVSGAFTGTYAINPLNGERIPIWIADYVLAGYGTGAVMGVPSGDQRDYLFAKHFDLPIIPILDAQQDIDKQADPTKEGRYINSGLINGHTYQEALPVLYSLLQNSGFGKPKVNYRMRDAVFGRQRYWGEPVPVYFKGGLPYLMDEQELPLVLPEVDKYLPTESGEPPLGRAKDWKYRGSPKSSQGERASLQASGAYRQQSDPANYGNLKENARLHRKQPTRTESILWEFLRNSRTGYKFRRQHPIDNFIVDFACLQKGLIVELDGGYHSEIVEEDKLRIEILGKYGFQVLRFTNDEIIANPIKVTEDIEQVLSTLPDRKSVNSDENQASPTGRDLDGAYEYELSTMPGWAGSSWYWYRYMDANNEHAFADKKAIGYWKDVDLYIGGSEHATGHLLYSRFWNKFLKDLGLVEEEEPFKKLINQGMIQGTSEKMYVLSNRANSFQSPPFRLAFGEEMKQILFSSDFFPDFDNHPIFKFHQVNVDVTFVKNNLVDIQSYLNSEQGRQYSDAVFMCQKGYYLKGEFIQPKDDAHSQIKQDASSKFKTVSEVEKMSKSKFNVVNPDDLIERYGADTLRMYEMFLGPLEQSKPWNTNGIEGVFKFLRKFWKLFHDDQFNFVVSDEEPAKAELKSLHKIIKKAEEDIERFSFNTSVSSFMICVNELTDLKCNKRKILEELVVVLSPYAPHITEELWSLLGHAPGTISYAAYPKFNPEHMIESEFSYPISVNGKMRMNLNIPLSLAAIEVEKLVLSNPDFQKYLEGKTPRKVIFVKGKIVNIVV